MAAAMEQAGLQGALSPGGDEPWYSISPLAAMSLGLSSSQCSHVASNRRTASRRPRITNPTSYGGLSGSSGSRQTDEQPCTATNLNTKPPSAHTAPHKHTQRQTHHVGKALHTSLMLIGGIQLVRTVFRQLRQAWPGSQGLKSAGKAQAGLVWLRNDLRLTDHEALTTAVQQCETVVPVYCFDPRDHHHQAGPSSSTSTCISQVARLTVILDSLADLRAQLQARGTDLVVRCGRPEHVLPHLAALLRAKHVYCHQEVTRDDVATEARVAAVLRKVGVGLQSVWGSTTLHHLDDLPFTLHHMAPDYNSFQQRVDHMAVRPPLPAPDALGPWPAHLNLAPGRLPPVGGLGLDSYPMPAAQGGERAAQQYLARLACSARHAQLPGHDNSVPASSLAQWLAAGCISPRQVHQALCGSQTDVKHLQWLRFELMWRDFFRLMTCKFSAAALNCTPTAA